VEAGSPLRLVPAAPGAHGLLVEADGCSHVAEGSPRAEEKHRPCAEDDPAALRAHEPLEFPLLRLREGEVLVCHPRECTRA